jgi:hypothetical protein
MELNIVLLIDETTLNPARIGFMVPPIAQEPFSRVDFMLIDIANVCTSV